MTESFFGLSRWPSFHAVFVNNRVLVQKGNVNCLQLPAFTFNDHSVSSQEATCKAELGENKKRGSGQELPGSQILLVRYCRGFGCFLLVNSLNQFEPYILFIIINRLSSVKCSVVSNTTKKKRSCTQGEHGDQETFSHFSANHLDYCGILGCARKTRNKLN